MKKLYILILCGVSTYAYGQQLANSDFENWTNHPGNSIFNGYKEVDNWASGNSALDIIPKIPTNPVAPTTQTTVSQHGTYAVKLTTQKIFGQLAAGNLFTGKFKLNTKDPVKSAQIGIPYSSRPTAFNVYYKYASVKGDSCSMYALLTKYNTSTHKRDTIGLGSFVSSTSVSTYTLLNMPITYTSTEAPDTISMVFTSSADGGNFKGQVGSALTIDNFSLEGVAGALSTTASLATVSAVLYPNPAQSRVMLSNAPSESGTVYFYNVSGTLVASQKWSGTRSPEFPLDNIAAGFYTCKFITSDDAIFATKLLITE